MLEMKKGRVKKRAKVGGRPRKAQTGTT